jgi:nucleotide-binding universal stress UspA family protein
MFQRIPVPLDGTARAERALPIAGRLAHASGGSIILFQVVVNTDESWVYRSREMVSTRHTRFAQRVAEGLAYLSTIPQMQGLGEVETQTIVCSGAVVAQTILDVASSHDVDLIVMCSRGYTGLKRWVEGSETQKLVSKTPVPVLVLHAEGGKCMNFSLGETRSACVLALLDGYIQAEAVLVPAAYLSAALSIPLQGTLHIVQVPGLSTPFEKGQKERVSVARQQTLSEANAYLSSAQQRLHDGDLAHLKLMVTSSVAFNMDGAQALRSMSEHGKGLEAMIGDSRCDVIAVAMDDRKGRERRMTRSMSERLLGATKLPLFIVGTPTSGGSHYKRMDVELEMSGQSLACNALRQS